MVLNKKNCERVRFLKPIKCGRVRFFSENRRQRHLKQKIAGGHDSKPKNRMWGRLLTKTASGAVFAPKSRVWRWLETEKSHVEAWRW